MIDANARYIPKGVKFFVSGYVDKDSDLIGLGVISGQSYLCKMLDNTNDTPRISIKVNGKVCVVKIECDHSFLTYKGVPSGKGFISDKSRESCKKLIGEFNDTYWKRRKEFIK